MKKHFTNVSVPVLGFVGFSGSGKTTLLVRVIPELKGRGVRTAVLKHAHHSFDVDTPGKDSYEIRHSGAQQVVVASRTRWALMVENSPNSEPSLEYLIQRLDCSNLDLILVEGFKTETHEKIEIHRKDSPHDFLYPTDPNIIAIATEAGNAITSELPLLDINRPDRICDFICAHSGLNSEVF